MAAPGTHAGLSYRRRTTRTVRIGDVAVGSDHPIRVQSMTTPATTDTAATVAQIERLAHAGCEIVRVTVPTSRDADSLPIIRAEMKRRGIRLPLVADIHFTPAVALRAVEHVDKVRINPGNFADKKKFAVREYSDAEYRAELDRIESAFAPLVRRAQELGVSMRIGTNHGSLSDRIMNRYGDTPVGMVESALEFVRICEAHGYRELILSMKASNPLVVLHAYRLLCARMAAESMDYPLHLGVTEAGDGEDGRIKSAIGIGVLLAEGMGDTVRVSLTEDPVAEIPVALALVEPFNRLPAGPARASRAEVVVSAGARDACERERRACHAVRVGPHALGGANAVAVEVPIATAVADEDGVRRELDRQAGARVPEETRAEIASVRVIDPTEIVALERLRRAVDSVAPRLALSAEVPADWLIDADGGDLERWARAAHRLHLRIDEARPALARVLAACASAGGSALLEARSVEVAVELGRIAQGSAPGRVLLAYTADDRSAILLDVRRLAAGLAAAGLDPPLVLLARPRGAAAEPTLDAAVALGGLLCDGIGDAIHVDAGTPTDARRLAFAVLQGSRVRITRTEFISCPSCGRTLFDLELTTARIKARTAHLKGVKIAVMGCVVNGPGEMADADFGYVGWGEEKIALFVGKEMVAKDIPTAEADERLVELIRRHGRWVDPPVPAAEEA
jgi:(E)-4-hydroxy-3-methylbut-2-enyl-diphosphate synthase